MLGYESHAGLSACLNGPALTDSLPVKMIKALGGVPFVRTIVPQSMLRRFSVLSSNPIDGICCHPHFPDRSPCGSSSGEGALIGGGGSCLGFGTDIGGSIRLPAAVCGIVGFKPTTRRLRYYFAVISQTSLLGP
ncbi:unnamed protein product [Protopolystoma xenopodis]|uniref:Amidase domain-containing protein n=1 Tax=Protopolystoma xenopodis TaxID=117903 RepID=A0A3S5B8B1_9PLAT|nr:unnamed protein product [Protopolystoma xenopodis]